MKSFLILIGFVGIAHCVSVLDLVSEEWNAFKAAHNKQYASTTEENFRRKIYMENALYVAQHNQRFQMGEETYELALNEWSDMLHQEFTDTLNGYNRTVVDSDSNSDLNSEISNDNPYWPPLQKLESFTYIPGEHITLDEQVDWRGKGAVTGVKNQGQCGSCWSFSATGALEGQHFRRHGRLPSLSEQNLVDCSTRYGNHGCHGGLMDNAFRYIRDNKGIDTEQSYPYEARDNRCRYNSRNSGSNVRGIVDLPRGNEEALKHAVATIGPIAVAIDAGQRGFQQYRGGVYFDPRCSTTNLNHAVLVVGYGNEGGMDYWLVKNSWGTTWGMGGYIKMARNRGNHCGIAVIPSYPLL